jgi:uncharacterized protein YggE
MSFIDRAKDVAGDVKDKTGDFVGKIGEKIPDSVKDTAGDFKDKAGELVDKVKERLGFADESSDAEAVVSDAADTVSDATDDAAGAAKERAADVADAAKSRSVRPGPRRGQGCPTPMSARRRRRHPTAAPATGPRPESR